MSFRIFIKTIQILRFLPLKLHPPGKKSLNLIRTSGLPFPFYLTKRPTTDKVPEENCKTKISDLESEASYQKDIMHDLKLTKFVLVNKSRRTCSETSF